jgi:alpha-L-arabinofuranosidase
LAKEGHTNWNPDLIYFNNKEVKPTANYYVQRAFGQNNGDEYIYADLQVNGGNDIRERLDHSVVKDNKTGDIIIKVVSLLPKASTLKIQLGEEALKGYSSQATLSLLSKENAPDRQREWDKNTTRSIQISGEFTLDVPQYSVSVIRIKPIKR